MKTISKITAAVLVFTLNVNAQVKNKKLNGGPQQGTFVPHTPPHNNNQQQGNAGTDVNSQNQWIADNTGWLSGYGSYGSVTLGFGNSYYNNSYPYNTYYGNYHSAKKTAKYAIRSAGYVINEAVAYHNWNDIFSPILAKAIRHFNYSRDLFRWGNFSAAINHAERAHYLAWYSLQCFSNAGYYDENMGSAYNQPNPYSDPYNPYYKTADPKTPVVNGKENRTESVLKDDTIDSGLPGSKLNDKELIKSFDQSNLKDE